jgi:hypothetical protein
MKFFRTKQQPVSGLPQNSDIKTIQAKLAGLKPRSAKPVPSLPGSRCGPCWLAIRAVPRPRRAWTSFGHAATC